MNECVLIFSNEVAAGQQRWMAFHYNLPKPAATLPFPTLLLLLRLIEARSLFCALTLADLFFLLFSSADLIALILFSNPSVFQSTPQCPLNPGRYHPSISSSRYRPVWERRKKKRGTVKLLWSLGCNEKVFNAFPSFKWQGVHGGRSRKADLTAPGRERAMMC